MLEGVPVDGDDPAHVQWIYDKAKERADSFNIQGLTYRLTQGENSQRDYLLIAVLSSTQESTSTVIIWSKKPLLGIVVFSLSQLMVKYKRALDLTTSMAMTMRFPCHK